MVISIHQVSSWCVCLLFCIGHGFGFVFLSYCQSWSPDSSLLPYFHLYVKHYSSKWVLSNSSSILSFRQFCLLTSHSVSQQINQKLFFQGEYDFKTDCVPLIYCSRPYQTFWIGFSPTWQMWTRWHSKKWFLCSQIQMINLIFLWPPIMCFGSLSSSANSISYSYQNTQPQSYRLWFCWKRVQQILV